MKRSAALMSVFLILTTALPLRANAWEGPLPPEVVEVIQEQKAQIDDYAALVTQQEEKIRILNSSLNDCRRDYKEKIRTCANQSISAENSATWAYILTGVSVVLNAVLGTAMYVMSTK